MHICKNSLPLVLIFLLTSCGRPVWVKEDFEAIRYNVKTISVMPPQTECYERMAGGTEPNPELNSKVSRRLKNALNKVLEEEGFVMKDANLSDSILIKNQDLALSFTRLQTRFDAICDSIGKLKIKKETYKTDPEIGMFADHTGADYLLFSRGKAYKSSEASKEMEALSFIRFGTPMQLSEGLILELALFDANTAEAIWYNGNLEAAGLDPLRVLELMKHCKNLLNEKFLEKK
jgi:hypothetical protein